MSTDKHHLTKKELKEDSLITGYYKAYALFEQYKKEVFIGLGVAALIIAGIIFYNYYQNEQSIKAETALAKVMPSYDGGAYLEAIEGKAGTDILGLQKIVDSYGSTEKGNVAKIYLANSFYNLGKVEKAKEYYDSYSGSNEMFRATSYAGLAACAESAEKWEEAANEYIRAAKVSDKNALTPRYLILAAVNYIKLNKVNEAKELLDQVKADYSYSLFARDADKYLQLVKQ